MQPRLTVSVLVLQAEGFVSNSGYDFSVFANFVNSFNYSIMYSIHGKIRNLYYLQRMGDSSMFIVSSAVGFTGFEDENRFAVEAYVKKLFKFSQ